MSQFEPIVKKKVVAEDITARVLDLLKSGELRPGDRLPAERDLAVQLNVSRASLREALRALAMMNIVEMRQGDGTYVSSLEPQLLVEPLDFVFELDTSTLTQLFEARKVVEVGCVALAAERISDAELIELEATLEKSVLALGDLDATLAADLELHQIIIEASRNPMLVRFMASVGQLGLASRRITNSSRKMREQILVEHTSIVAALKARDASLAQTAMLIHLSNTQSSLPSNLDETLNS